MIVDPNMGACVHSTHAPARLKLRNAAGWVSGLLK
jgi:hypothetical protein